MRIVAIFILALAAQACATMPVSGVAADPAQPIIVGHRGASSERPEHTLEAYQRAIDQSADYIEPDLVMTRDGILVARHENEISGTTDIADHPEFADRRTTKTIDGRSVTGWFTEDLTLTELRTLRARERLPDLRPDSAAYDGQYVVPTLAEIIELVQRQARPVGLIPEIKHPGYFASIGLPMEDALARQLAEAGYDSPNDLAMIQSFEIGPLAALDILTDLRLVQLVGRSGAPADARETSYAHMITPAGLQAVAAYADVISPHKSQIARWGAADNAPVPTSLVADAHAAGLLIIPYTFRPENYFLPVSLRSSTSDPRQHGQSAAEIAAFLRIGIDGLFTDHVPSAILARDGSSGETDPVD